MRKEIDYSNLDPHTRATLEYAGRHNGANAEMWNDLKALGRTLKSLGHTVISKVTGTPQDGRQPIDDDLMERTETLDRRARSIDTPQEPSAE